MKLLFLDFETQGSDPAVFLPTEAGALLVEREVDKDLFGEDVQRFVEKDKFSALIYEIGYPCQTEEIVEITGITNILLRTLGKSSTEVLPKLDAMIQEADYVLAHNADFDKTVYEKMCERAGSIPMKPKKDWLCTINDVPWAKKYKCKKLSHLAYDHGILVDPSTLHRALDDVRLLSTLMEKFSMDEVIAYKNTPWIYVFLNGVEKPWLDKGVSNALAKELGFGWQKAPRTSNPEFPYRWVMKLKETELAALKARTPTQFTLTRWVRDGEHANETPGEIK